MSLTVERVGWRALTLTLLAIVAWGIAAFAGNFAASVRGSTAVQAPQGALLPGRDVRALASPHIPLLTSHRAAYDSDPPTSGPHVPWTVEPGIYRAPIARELQVHALEHGHVLIQYAPGSPLRGVLERIGRAHPHEVVVAPYRSIRSGVVLTAWARIERLNRADEPQIVAFVRALEGRYDHGWRR